MPNSRIPRARPSRLAAFVRAPALHFTVAGALLFAGLRIFNSDARPTSVPVPVSHQIVIDRPRIEALRSEWAIANHGPPDEVQMQSAVENFVSSEILLREALASGLEQGDRSIQWRLVLKMRYVGEDHGEDADGLARRAFAMGLHLSDPVIRQILIEKIRLVIGRAATPPTEEQLTAYYAQHRGEYAQAARVSFHHVFFDRSRRGGGEQARQAAAAAAPQVVGHGLEVTASLGGDTFLSGDKLTAQNRNDIIKFFGPAFADQVLAMPVGAWRGPVESAFGWHLVWVDQRTDERVPELAEVRSQVEKSYEHLRSRERVDEYVETKKREYDIRIDDSAIHGSGRG